MYKQFDVCQLITSKNIRFMSGPMGAKPSPHGNWIVVGNLPAGRLVLAKDQTVVVAPVTDVRKVADYDIKHLLKRKFEDIMKEMRNGEKGQDGETRDSND